MSNPQPSTNNRGKDYSRLQEFGQEQPILQNSEISHIMQTDNISSLSRHPPTTPHALQPRMMPFVINPFADWHFAFNEPPLILILIPLAYSAFITLSHLFSTILDKVLTIWAHQPPSNQIVLEAGNVRIEFGCTSEPVPMDFIAEFAASHRDAVERGFAPAFAKEWWWRKGEEGSGRLCYAGMRVVEDGVVVVPPS